MDSLLCKVYLIEWLYYLNLFFRNTLCSLKFSSTPGRDNIDIVTYVDHGLSTWNLLSSLPLMHTHTSAVAYSLGIITQSLVTFRLYVIR